MHVHLLQAHPTGDFRSEKDTAPVEWQSREVTRHHTAHISVRGGGCRTHGENVMVDGLDAALGHNPGSVAL